MKFFAVVLGTYGIATTLLICNLQPGGYIKGQRFPSYNAIFCGFFNVYCIVFLWCDSVTPYPDGVNPGSVTENP